MHDKQKHSGATIYTHRCIGWKWSQMTRCGDFYKKFRKEGNFCQKYPDTVKRITRFMNLWTKIEEEASRSEILSETSKPIGSLLSEGASRPLYGLKEGDLEKAIKLIVKKAEEKEMNDEKKPELTYKEVTAIVNTIVPSKVPKTAPKDPVKKKLENAFRDVPDDAIDAAIAKIDELAAILTNKKEGLEQRKAALATASGSDGQQLEVRA